MLHCIFALTSIFVVIPFLIRITFSTIKFTAYYGKFPIFNVLDSLIFAIILKTCEFITVLLGMYLLPDGSSRVLQLLSNPSKINKKIDSNTILNDIYQDLDY